MEIVRRAELKIANNAKLVVQNCMFKLWQWRNPGADFKAYFRRSGEE
jgi:hypothetical protein